MRNIFEILKDVLSDKRLTAFDKNVFSCLLTYNGKGRIFPSRREIMNRLNSRNLPTISKSVNKLQETGYIEITRRKQKSNIYKIKTYKVEMKTKNEKPIAETDVIKEVKYMNKAMVEIVAGEVAKAKGNSYADSSDYIFVNSLLKIKAQDRHKDDCFNNVRNCLILLYLINKYYDKFTIGNNTFAYFKKIYSLTSYETIRKEIFEINIPTVYYPDKNILNNPSINY